MGEVGHEADADRAVVARAASARAHGDERGGAREKLASRRQWVHDPETAGSVEASWYGGRHIPGTQALPQHEANVPAHSESTHRRPEKKMEEKVVTRKPNRPLAGPGDDVGAAELGRRVAENLRQRRKARGLSLDDLARSSGVSRAALSQIETCKSNPTVGVLWKIAVGLGVPFAELIGAPRSGVIVLKRGDAQVLRSSDGKFESRPLSPVGASPLVEIYELRLAARAVHASEAHAPGTHEVLVVLTGQLRMRVAEEMHELAAGDSVAFAADRPHAYENPSSGEARYHNVIVYER
jgi:transcriptional regulator with XRE-family HTH domain